MCGEGGGGGGVGVFVLIIEHNMMWLLTVLSPDDIYLRVEVWAYMFTK